MTQPTIKKSALDIGTGPNSIVTLDAGGLLPAVDGSQLTNINTSGSVSTTSTSTINDNVQVRFGNSSQGVLSYSTSDVALTMRLDNKLRLQNGFSQDIVDLNPNTQIYNFDVDVSGTSNVIVGTITAKTELRLDGPYSEEFGTVLVTTGGSKALEVDNFSYMTGNGSMTTSAITFAITGTAFLGIGRTYSFTLELLDMDNPSSITWPVSVLWSGGTEPTWQSGITLITFITRDEGTTWYAMVGGQGFA